MMSEALWPSIMPDYYNEEQYLLEGTQSIDSVVGSPNSRSDMRREWFNKFGEFPNDYQAFRAAELYYDSTMVKYTMNFLSSILNN